MERPGTGADAAGLERNRESGPTEFFFQPRRDQTDDPRVPAFRGSHDNGALLLDAECGTRLGFGLRQRRLFDSLPFLIEPIEFGRDFCSFDRIVFDQEPHAEIGAADAPAGIDARPEQKTEMPRFGRRRKPRHVHQADMPRPLAPA